MKWLIATLGLGTLALGAPFVTGVDEARACSSSDDPAELAEVLVTGRVTGWDYVLGPDGQPVEYLVASRDTGSRKPIRIHVAVEEVYKGNAPATIDLADNLLIGNLRAEGMRSEDYQWPGEAGECFGLMEDPTGQAVWLPLKATSEAGVYDAIVVWQGDSIVTNGDRLRRFGPPKPPFAGNTPAAQGEAASDHSPALLFGLILGGFLLAVFVTVLVGPVRNGDDG
jgi:hypothetical protein